MIYAADALGGSAETWRWFGHETCPDADRAVLVTTGTISTSGGRDSFGVFLCRNLR